jgi:hypothetical protein
MICNLTIGIGGPVIELAGGNGRESETSGLRIDTETNFERVAYLGVTDGRQFARPGSYVSASFSSIQTFSTVQAAEAYVLGLPADLADQSGATAQLGREVPTIVVTGTLSPAMAGTYTFREIFNGRAVYEKGTEATIGYSYIGWDSGDEKWLLIRLDSVSPLQVSAWESSSNVPDPEDATSWTAVSPATGTPTLTAGTVITPSLTIYDAQSNVSASHRGCAVTLDVQISGRLTAP